MFISWLTCSEHMLGFVLFLIHIDYDLLCLDPHILSVSILYNSRGFIMFFIFLFYVLLMDIMYFSHGL